MKAIPFYRIPLSYTKIPYALINLIAFVSYYHRAATFSPSLRVIHNIVDTNDNGIATNGLKQCEWRQK